MWDTRMFFEDLVSGYGDCLSRFANTVLLLPVADGGADSVFGNTEQ